MKADDPKPGLPISRYLPVLVVLDTSGSMADPAADNGLSDAAHSKIAAARGAVVNVVSAVAPDQQIGLIQYPGAGDDCSPGSTVIPLGPPDVAKTRAVLNQLQADGGTPTAAALLNGAEVLKKSGAPHGVIVLVSDGLAGCSGPVCDAAKKLVEDGYSLTVNTVGFDIGNDSEAASDLECTAEATGGRYADASDAAGLREALQKAAASYLRIEATVASKLPTVSGTKAIGTSVPVTVTNDGQQTASDVRVSLDFVGEKGAANVPITQPVKFVGNLGPGDSREVTFQVKPTQFSAGREYTWIASATTKDNQGAQTLGKTTIEAASNMIGSLLNVNGQVDIIGDSYSSGEGAGTYIDGTDGGQRNGVKFNRCHRSRLTYGGVLFGSKARILACSGAVTSEYLYMKDESGGVYLPTQASVLAGEVRRGDAPAAVLLTMGGNDVQFAELVVHCATRSNCGGSYATDLLETIPDLASSLIVMYQDIDAQVNGMDALAQRKGKIAPIVVLPYVAIIPEKGEGRDGCFAGISKSELDILDKFLDKLNSVVEDSVEAAKNAEGPRPIYFVEGVQQALQPDHTICARKNDDQWGNTVHRPVPGAAPVALGSAWASGNTEIAHPNAKGYLAVANAVADWSQHEVAVQASKAPYDVLHPNTIQVGQADDATLGVPGTVQPGGEIRIQGSGYAPQSAVQVQVQSAPMILGTVYADAEGKVHTKITLPPSLSRGRHHIELLGFDNEGEAVHERYGIWVVPRGTGFILIILLVGLLVVGFSFYARRRAAHPGGP